MYKAVSVAKVFSAGTIQWSWGLDANHDGTATPVSPVMQQATANVLRDLGAAATTLMSGMVAPSPSSDTTAPTATITSPASGAVVPSGSTVTVTGTASDTAGVVAGVEVSTDGGTTWHPANGTSSWSSSYVQWAGGAAQVRARAVYDSLNLGSSASVSFSSQCPCSLFGATVPGSADSGDSSPVEAGVRFSSSVSGAVTGVVTAAGGLTVAVTDGTRNTTTAISGSFTGAPDQYRVDWGAGSATFFVDGTHVGTSTFTPGVQLRYLATAPTADAVPVTVDWACIAPYDASATYTSAVVDAGAVVGWDTATAVSQLASGSTVTLRVRSGSTPTTGTEWTGWVNVPVGGSITRSARYLQYSVVITTSGNRFVARRSSPWT